MVETPRCLIVGRWEAAAFRHVPDLAARLTQVELASNNSHLWDRPGDFFREIDIVLLLQEFPGQYSAEQIERLRRCNPLCPVILVLGPWCEGETRTGQPYPGVLRVYWHQLEAQFLAEVSAICAGRLSRWNLAPTATQEEHFLHLAERPLPKIEATIGILTDQWDVYSWLSDAAARCGAASVWIRYRSENTRKAPKIDAALFDVRGCEYPDPQTVQRWCHRLGRVPALALLDFPRPHHVEQYQRAGIGLVLAKPVILHELAAQLARLVQHRDASTPH